MNSKKLALLAIFILLLLGGGIFALYTKKMNAVGFRGIPFSVQGIEREVVDDWVNTFTAVLQRDDALQIIVEDSEYASKLGLTEGEAVEHLRNAVNVNYSETRGTIQIGLRGARKNSAELDSISKVIFNVSAAGVVQVKPAFGTHYKAILERR